MFPKNEKHRFSVSDIFSKLLQPCFFHWSKAVCVNFHRPTYQEFTPTSNIALLILCSRQAIVPLCRPGGVRTARFNNSNNDDDNYYDNANGNNNHDNNDKHNNN